MPHHLVDDRDRSLAIAHADMDVLTADQEPASRPLHRFDEFVIARIRTDVLIARHSEWVRPSADDLETASCGGRMELLKRLRQVSAGLSRGVAHSGDDLDGALEEFVFCLRVVVAGETLGHLGKELV